ncbi:MAG: hypothetical protein U1E05_00265 [Patescibacteria group bacterium]|nr:hypothetical protein [Patescibacteria group bacterium]
MDRIKRREFRGSRIWVSLLCLTVIGIPIALLHLIESTIEIEYELDDAEAFLKQHFAGK